MWLVWLQPLFAKAGIGTGWTDAETGKWRRFNSQARGWPVGSNCRSGERGKQETEEVHLRRHTARCAGAVDAGASRPATGARNSLGAADSGAVPRAVAGGI